MAFFHDSAFSSALVERVTALAFDQNSIQGQNGYCICIYYRAHVADCKPGVISARFYGICHGDIVEPSNLFETCYNLGKTKIVSRCCNKIRPYDSVRN